MDSFHFDGDHSVNFEHYTYNVSRRVDRFKLYLRIHNNPALLIRYDLLLLEQGMNLDEDLRTLEDVTNVALLTEFRRQNHRHYRSEIRPLLPSSMPAEKCTDATNPTNYASADYRLGFNLLPDKTYLDGELMYGMSRLDEDSDIEVDTSISEVEQLYSPHSPAYHPDEPQEQMEAASTSLKRSVEDPTPEESSGFALPGTEVVEIRSHHVKAAYENRTETAAGTGSLLLAREDIRTSVTATRDHVVCLSKGKRARRQELTRATDRLTRGMVAMTVNRKTRRPSVDPSILAIEDVKDSQ